MLRCENMDVLLAAYSTSLKERLTTFLRQRITEDMQERKLARMIAKVALHHFGNNRVLLNWLFQLNGSEKDSRGALDRFKTFGQKRDVPRVHLDASIFF